jgi:hypothetical protein
MLPENIKKACELAQGAGECEYVIDGKPCCVIGQLYSLEGFDISNLEGNITCWHNVSLRNKDIIDRKYGELKLERLQSFWDSSKNLTNEELLEAAESIFGDNEDV